MFDQVYGYEAVNVDSEFGLSLEHNSKFIPTLDSLGNPLTYSGKYSLYDEITMNPLFESIPFDTLLPLSIPSSVTSNLSGRFILKIIYTSSSGNITHDEYIIIFKNERK